MAFCPIFYEPNFGINIKIGILIQKWMNVAGLRSPDMATWNPLRVHKTGLNMIEVHNKNAYYNEFRSLTAQAHVYRLPQETVLKFQCKYWLLFFFPFCSSFILLHNWFVCVHLAFEPLWTWMQRRSNLLWAFETAAIKIAVFVLSLHSFLPTYRRCIQEEQKGGQSVSKKSSS